jgi:hypothetical protein
VGGLPHQSRVNGCPHSRTPEHRLLRRVKICPAAPPDSHVFRDARQYNLGAEAGERGDEPSGRPPAPTDGGLSNDSPVRRLTRRQLQNPGRRPPVYRHSAYRPHNSTSSFSEDLGKIYEFLFVIKTASSAGSGPLTASSAGRANRVGRSPLFDGERRHEDREPGEAAIHHEMTRR